MKFDWNDIKFLDAMLKHGSAKRAAAALGVDQTTCARRIGSLEAALGVPLFEREESGYQPTASALALGPAAAAVAQCVGDFAARAAEARRRCTPVIRITAEEVFACAIVSPAVARFGVEHPYVQVEVDVTSERRDLIGGHADIALRAGPGNSDEPGLVRLKLSDDPFAFYCSEAYAQRHGVPTPADLGAHAIVSLETSMKMFKAAGLGQSVRQVVSSLPALEAAIRSGACVGVLPRVIGNGAPGLRLCFPVDAKSEVRILYPERLRNNGEIRALVRAVADQYRSSAMNAP